MTSHGLTGAYTNLTDSNIDFKIINRAGKLHQLPPPLEFTDSKSGRKTPLTTPLEIGPENCINYPPSNSRNLIDYPPSKSGRKTPSTTPPRIHGTSSTIPPSKSGRKTPCPFSHGFRFSKFDKCENNSAYYLQFRLLY